MTNLKIIQEEIIRINARIAKYDRRELTEKRVILINKYKSQVIAFENLKKCTPNEIYRILSNWNGGTIDEIELNRQVGESLKSQ